MSIACLTFAFIHILSHGANGPRIYSLSLSYPTKMSRDQTLVDQVLLGVTHFDSRKE